MSLQTNFWSCKCLELQSAITALLAFVPPEDEGIETLSLDGLSDLAWRGALKYPGLESAATAIYLLRGYLMSLPGYGLEQANGAAMPDVTREHHTYIAMQVLANQRGNAESIGMDQPSVVIASILPVSPTDDELRGKA